MPKITAQDIKDLGFVREMFGTLCVDDAAFTTFLTAVIAEKALELEGRIGSTVYADATAPNVTYVTLAEKYLSAAEMLQRRINVVAGNTESSINATYDLRLQLERYLDKAEIQIAKLAQGVTEDDSSAGFASGALVTSHFE